MKPEQLAEALREFGKMEEGQLPPGNATTLWREIVRGVERVANKLTEK